MEMSAYIWPLNMDTKRLEYYREVSPSVIIYSNLAWTIISPSVKILAVIVTNAHGTSMKVIFIRLQKNLLLFSSRDQKIDAPRRISGRNLSSISY